MGQRVAHGTKTAAPGGRLRYAGRISLQQKMERREWDRPGLKVFGFYKTCLLYTSKLKIRRKAGSAIVIVAVIAAVIGISYWGVSLLAEQLSGFVHDLPVLWHSLEEDVSNAGRLLQRFTQYLSPDIQSQITAVIDGLTGWVSAMANQVGSHTVTVVGNYAKNIPSILVGVIMCLLSSYLLDVYKRQFLIILRTISPPIEPASLEVRSPL